MGNARGFLDFKRVDFKKVAPKERVLNFQRIYNAFRQERTRNSGRTMYGLWGSILPYGCDE